MPAEKTGPPGEIRMRLLSHRERVLTVFDREAADRPPVDFGGSPASRINLYAYQRLKRHLGLPGPVRVSEVSTPWIPHLPRLFRVDPPTENLAGAETRGSRPECHGCHSGAVDDRRRIAQTHGSRPSDGRHEPPRETHVNPGGAANAPHIPLNPCECRTPACTPDRSWPRSTLVQISLGS